MTVKKYLYINNKGLVMPVALVFLAILAIVGTTTAVMTTSDLKFCTFDKTGKQAVYVSESGIEEARARLMPAAPYPILDNQPTAPQWSVFIGNEVKSVKKGFQIGNSMHSRINSIQSALDYAVRISHQTDASGQILLYGDSDGDGIYQRNTSTGQIIYLVSSTGYASSSKKILEAEMSRVPPVPVVSALYVEAPTTIQGSTSVNGLDQCGGADLPGIVSTQPTGSVTVHGVDAEIDGSIPIEYDAQDMDVDRMAETFKYLADFSYAVESATHTDSTVPGPGDGWGTPTLGETLQDPSSCSESNIVYYDTHDTDIKLAGATGCGILVVDGDLEVFGDFNWYGVVIATGSIRYTGGGNKNCTGAQVAGGSTIADVIGGNSNIVYCSSAITDVSGRRPLTYLTWNENM